MLHSGEKSSFFNKNSSEKTGYLYVNNKMNPWLIPHIKINLQLIKDLSKT